MNEVCKKLSSRLLLFFGKTKKISSSLTSYVFPNYHNSKFTSIIVLHSEEIALNTSSKSKIKKKSKCFGQLTTYYSFVYYFPLTNDFSWFYFRVRKSVFEILNVRRDILRQLRYFISSFHKEHPQGYLGAETQTGFTRKEFRK